MSEFWREGSALTAKIRFSNRGTTRAQPDSYYSESYVFGQCNHGNPSGPGMEPFEEIPIQD